MACKNYKVKTCGEKKHSEKKKTWGKNAHTKRISRGKNQKSNSTRSETTAQKQGWQRWISWFYRPPQTSAILRIWIESLNQQSWVNFQAIPLGVLFCRLTTLTSDSKYFNSFLIDELYPQHVDALRSAGLALATFPTIGSVCDCKWDDEWNKLWRHDLEQWSSLPSAAIPQ